MKTSKYTVGEVITERGMQAQVYCIGLAQPDGFGGEYRMIGIEYLTGIRSAIMEREASDAQAQE